MRLCRFCIRGNSLFLTKFLLNTFMETTMEAFKRLTMIMDDLREKCPWDKKQTIQTLRQLTIEETYELADAITDEDWKSLKEELGDLMLHIIFYAKIGTE